MPKSKDEDLLKEIRANWDYARTYWREVYSEGSIDMRYLIKGPWTEDDLDSRKGRPTLSLDELSQYINQEENQARQNKRAVKVRPEGYGADDQTALNRGGIIRGIEYKCKAQQAYITALGSMLRRSYGYFKLTTDYEPGTMNRVLKIVRIPNPDVIYLDPDFKEADAADCEWSFEIDSMSEKKFMKRWPKSQVRSFSLEEIKTAPGWITLGQNGKQVQVASYCRVEQGKKTLIEFEDSSVLDLSENPEVQVTEEDGQKYAIIPEQEPRIITEIRQDNDPKVIQYVTNGLEILESNPLDFKEIPIIPVFGPEEWLTEGGAAKRVFLSMVRGARDNYKGFCYAKSAMVERMGMDPKAPYEGYVGQFATNTNWQTLANNPVGYVEFQAITEATGGAVLPIPSRTQVPLQIGDFEMAAESFRRGIQANMGGSPLPTAAQRQNEKSGAALQRIEQSSDEGNYHFMDNFDRALERAGRMMDNALDVVYDTPNRPVPFNDEAGEHKILYINQYDEQGNKIGFHVGSGNHGVTISTGPSTQSQREEAEDFTNQLISNPAILGPNTQKILALLVKLRNLGPVGDRIADILDPSPNDIPPQIGAQIQQAQTTIQALTAEIQRLKSGDDTKRWIAQLQEETKRIDTESQEKTKRVIGLIKVDQQDAEVRLNAMLGSINDRFDRLAATHQQLMAQQHEREMQIADHSQQQDLATQQAEQQPAEPQPVQ